MSFTPETAVDATATVLGTVAEAGRVHKYRRTVFTEADVTRHLRSEELGKIAAAFISTPRITTTRDFGNPAQAGVMTKVGVELELFRGIEDAEESEIVFRRHVFAVLQAINTRGRIDDQASHQEPANADQVGYIAFAGGTVILHYAVIRFALQGRTSPTA